MKRSNYIRRECNADVEAYTLDSRQEPSEVISEKMRYDLQENFERQVDNCIDGDDPVQDMIDHDDYCFASYLDTKICGGEIPKFFQKYDDETDLFEFGDYEIRIEILTLYEAFCLLNDDQYFREDFQNHFFENDEHTQFLEEYEKEDDNHVLDEFQIENAWEHLSEKNGEAFLNEFAKFFANGITAIDHQFRNTLWGWK